MTTYREPFQFNSVLQLQPGNPETRPSLLAVLSSDNNELAWAEFTEIYSPVIYRYCRKKGLQEADALEVLQDVLLQVYQYIAAFDYDPDRGRFRAWLQTVTYSRLCRFWKKKSNQQEQTGHEQAIELKEAEDFFNSEFVYQVTQKALREIRDDFHDETWQAFHQTWVEQRSADEVATELDRSVGWVYVAKSRVLKKLTSSITRHVNEA